MQNTLYYLTMTSHPRICSVRSWTDQPEAFLMNNYDKDTVGGASPAAPMRRPFPPRTGAPPAALVPRCPPLPWPPPPRGLRRPGRGPVEMWAPINPNQSPSGFISNMSQLQGPMGVLWGFELWTVWWYVLCTRGFYKCPRFYNWRSHSQQTSGGRVRVWDNFGLARGKCGNRGNTHRYHLQTAVFVF